ncbi:MAG TPA: hypothetical protein VLI06_07790 [Solimonas sp.]|nr:hypothetical protein [Solimonas sp.]
MPRYQMVVLSNPVEGREDEYNDWYQNVHLAQVVAFKGIQSAQRLRLSNNLIEGKAWPYAAIYRIESDDIEGLLQDFRASAGTERMTMSDALDTAGAYAAIYEECGAVVEAKRS